MNTRSMLNDTLQLTELIVYRVIRDGHNCYYVITFIRRFYQAIHLYCHYVCSLGIEPTTFALLTQCSTTEPQEHCKYINIYLK